MNKQELLLREMNAFRSTLVQAAKMDPQIESVLSDLTPLFQDIEAGQVLPPCTGRFPRYFHSEDSKYGMGSTMEEASANFRSALEDWASKPWYPK